MNIKAKQSIANKLKRMIQLVSGIALLVATLLFVCLSLYSYRQQTVQHFNALTDIIATSTRAAIINDDTVNTRELITSLRELTMISGAVIYKPDWQTFAATPMDEATKVKIADDQSWRLSVAASGVRQFRTTFTYLDMLHPIYHENKIIAYLFIEGSLAPLYENLLSNLFFITMIWLVIMAGVFLFSKNLHKRITGPIESLINGMEEVSQEHDFSMRLPVITEDEIGVITNSFNVMLGQVQLRDNRLENYRNELARDVEIRTHELKIAMDDAIKSKEIAETANQSKSEFLATMSHEIRTPMNGVLGMLDMMMRTDLTAQQQKYASTILKSGELLLMVVNDILDFSKIEAGQFELKQQDFNVCELVNEVIEMLRVQADSKNLELYQTPMTISDCTVNGDRCRLVQILVNLVSNAIKFTEHGEVNVSAEIRDLDENKKLLKFVVSDTGIGIEADKKHNIFNAFVQADGSMARSYSGTGLGLAISKRLIELMDGEIHLESEAGKGSTFTFCLPVNAAGITEIVPITHNTTQQLNKSSILLAEDNIMNQEVATEMLNFMGHTVDVASNGDEAVKMSQLKHYDIVLMDCQMPVKDGFAATRDIRSSEKTTKHRHIIIALTGNALIGDKEKCMDAGMDDFLSKPFSYEQLETKLGNHTKPADATIN